MLTAKRIVLIAYVVPAAWAIVTRDAQAIQFYVDMLPCVCAVLLMEKE